MSLLHPVDTQTNTTQDAPEVTASDAPVTEATASDAPTPAAEPTGPSFAQLGLPQPLVTALERKGITHPFAIQTVALPDALAGRDVLGKAATGSGKTLAFGLPLLARLGAEPLQGRRAPRGLVLVPTRELAQQVHDALAPLAQSIGVQLAAVYGGASMYRQIQQLRRGVDVVIATPGRLQDLINQRECSLEEVSIAIIDEADFMSDLGFLPVVKELLDQTRNDGQRLLFSATLDGEVDTLVRRYLKDPARHSVVTAADAAPPAEHVAYSVSFPDKLKVTEQIAARPGRTIVFVRTQHGADRLAGNLQALGIGAEAIHGGLPQAARRRALEAFTDARSPVLVATDVAARGIHVDDVSLVVHYDPPADHKTYLHRSGRTARAGAGGKVVSLLLPDQVGQAKRRFRQAGIDTGVSRIRPGDAPIGELVASGVHVEPVQRPVRSSRPAGAGGGRPRRDGGRPSSGGRSYGERSSSSSYGERSTGGSYGDRRPAPDRGARSDRPSFGDRRPSGDGRDRRPAGPRPQGEGYRSTGRPTSRPARFSD
ncbi:DEAD/DEAH box helicase [Modestobacter sp. I12A-02628]|uniref:DEAD/DEAH box helicase n=1 Tax=Goekera deserti TaxID=2497753 RepID=A0A7K3W879_9ACTN|nr:DEAD/DEAH box helicase [Goekera deserti]MPR00284.1 DEAD/DEAH box helicase [Goekera deserti]NDI49458.1 DEAD/DEAH box helicase [Goekera deserti]NEL52668.1 DEAD/DEAH box helicase [Goekera deserti]